MRVARGLHRLTAAAALAMVAALPAAGQLGVADWAAHRGTAERVGANSGSTFTGSLEQVYLWPNSRDIPGEIVVDNAPPMGRTYPLSTGQNYITGGTWADAPTGNDRASGGWPPVDGRTSVLGGYQYTEAVTSSVLAQLGVTLLAGLPNLGTDAEGVAGYKAVHDELVANGTTFARWTFGAAYPLGTKQGLRDVAFDASTSGAFRQPLEPGQRYAVYIRWPASGTTVSGVVRPIADNVLVRVSWGSDPDDARTSRIFLVNTGQTGGFWARIRTGEGDDRYFPYDGTNPIRVTLYALTPDAVTDTTQYAVRPLVVADAVRLVPEAFRGDVHASAASALFTSAGGNPTRVTWFGRDETVGPLRLIQDATYLAALKTEYGDNRHQPVAPFGATLFDPTKAPNSTSSSTDFNPTIPDPTTSIRTASFYCLEDIVSLSRYGQLRWRYSASTSEVATSGGGTTVALPTATIDDNAAAFTHTGFTEPAQSASSSDQAFGSTLRKAQVVAYSASTIPQATWTATLPVKGHLMPADGTAKADYWTGQTYTVMAWIPAASNAAHYAHYRLDTLYGAADHYVDQRMSADGKAVVGGWRTIATHVRFPFSSGNQVGVVHLLADAPSDGGTVSRDDVGQLRYVYADAIQFVPETLSPASVLAAPHFSVDRKSNGTATPASRDTVHFVTDEGAAGHVWALNPFGTSAIGAASTGTLTTAYWVYPSLTALTADPNYKLHSASDARAAIDGELQKVSGEYTILYGMPALSGFRSSPAYIEQGTSDTNRDKTFLSYLLMGNQNGRLYGLDPTGRGDSTAASADTAGTPGTTERVMTWPTTARDRYRIHSGTFASQAEDAGVTFISASPSSRTSDTHQLCDLVVVGAGDGHIYAFDPANINVSAGGKPSRMYNYTATAEGVPAWQYPKPTVKLDPITYTGAITKPSSASSEQYIVAAAGRVISVNTRAQDTVGSAKVARLRWAFPWSNPQSPKSSDTAAMDLPFTAPVWQASVTGLNSDKEVAFVANQDGILHALDASVGLTQPSDSTDLWTARTSLGSTRSSPVFVSRLVANFTGRTTGPALLMPYDNGLLFGLKCVDGNRTWQYSDGDVGAVPMSDTSGATIAFPTSYVFRGADAITANNFMYNGDEGLLDTGEIHGQFHAYGDASLTGGGGFVPDEPNGQGAGPNGLFDFRGGDIVTQATFDSVNSGGMSGSTAMGASNLYANNGPSTAIYEWGDSIRVVAWGAFANGASLPTSVQFRFTGRGANRVVVAAPKVDTKFSGALSVDLPAGGTTPAAAWVATASIPLGLPSEQDPQTPGSQYRIAIQVSNSAGQRVIFWETGHRVDQHGTVQGGTSRTMSVAHPLALSTGGAPTTDALASPNVIGWVRSLGTANAFTELLGNGNRLTADVSGIATQQNQKDLYAPIGMAPHGAATAYSAVTSAGARVPGLFVVDRSNLFLMNQRIRNVRADRKDLAWSWDPSDSSQQATGNAMNPLPWETLPTAVPNVSPDYPDIDRSMVAFRAAGADLAAGGAALSARPSAGAILPTSVDLTVTVPKYQPANVNAAYYDINGVKQSSPVYAPMVAGTSGGSTATSGPALFPSSGYVGATRIYVGIGNRETFEDRFAYREVRVGVGVPPDLSFRTLQETVDLGNMPHGAGYAPNVKASGTNAPFAPSITGPYNGGLSPFDMPGSPSFFAPVSVVSESNVNLVNLRVAKIIGNAGTSITDPNLWLRLGSDQVETRTGVGQIWGVSSFLLALGAGNAGVISSLDHSRTSSSQFEIDYITRYGMARSMWPQANAYVPTIAAGSTFASKGWAAGTQPRPTLHKPRPGDPVGTTMTVPDTAYGDPAGVLASAGVDLRPKVGVAVPMGTPVGVYSAPISVFEDAYPAQWRAWVQAYQTLNGGGSGPMNIAVDDDGVLNANQPLSSTPVMVEATTRTPFRLRVAVREARLTNGTQRALPAAPSGTPAQASRVQPDGAYLGADGRAWDYGTGVQQPVLGANLQPAVWRSPSINNGGMVAYWVANRQPQSSVASGGDPWAAPAVPDVPWLLIGSRLKAAIGTAKGFGTVYDWQFNTDATRWWSTPLTPFPDVQPSTLAQLFPSAMPQQGDVPVGVPGAPIARTARQSSPTITADLSGNPWLFWQGQVQKAAGSEVQYDSRTFYQALDPTTGAPTGSLFTFANDPSMPKYGPRATVAPVGSSGAAYLFWYGGPTGRSRLYYNVKLLSSSSLSTAGGWSADAALSTPGTLQWQSDPSPVVRSAYAVDDDGVETAIQALDLFYAGAVKERSQAETFMTRYAIDSATGALSVARLPRVDNETLARDGARQTWLARDIAWVYRSGSGYVTADTPYHGIVLSLVRGDGSVVTPLNVGAPTFDTATNRLYYASALGGQLYVEPQTGTVTFPDVAPRTTDRVVASYTPRTRRICVTRSGMPGDPGVANGGVNTAPVAFLDRMSNPRVEAIVPPATTATSPSLTRQWIFYRKAGAGVEGSGGIYYKPQRLMVQLPSSILPQLITTGTYAGMYTGTGSVTMTSATTRALGAVEVDWIRGRLYFTEQDEGNVVNVAYRNASGSQVSSAPYRVAWADEMTTGLQGALQSISETPLPTMTTANEGQVAAFKDPFQDKVWVFWTSTRSGVSDVYYEAISPRFYPEPRQ